MVAQAAVQVTVMITAQVVVIKLARLLVRAVVLDLVPATAMIHALAVVIKLVHLLV